MAKKSVRVVAGLMYPTLAKITGRSSTIRAQFIKAIIPEILPSAEQQRQALSVLEQQQNKPLVCSYCGADASEWDHFNSVVDDKKATGYVTDVYNLVPACGKCNQSKGSQPWYDWMTGNARLAPRNKKDFNQEAFERRIQILQNFQKWGNDKIYRLPASMLDSEEFKSYFATCEHLIASFKPYQDKAEDLKKVIARLASE